MKRLTFLYKDFPSHYEYFGVSKGKMKTKVRQGGRKVLDGDSMSFRLKFHYDLPSLEIPVASVGECPLGLTVVE